MRIIDVFTNILSKSTREIRSHSLAQFSEIVALAIFRTETFFTSEYVLINDSGKTIKFKQRVLKGCSCKQKLFNSAKRITYSRCSASRSAINITELMSFVDDSQFKAFSNYFCLMLGCKIITTNNNSFRIQWVFSIAYVGIEILGVKNFALYTKFVMKLCFPLFT